MSGVNQQLIPAEPLSVPARERGRAIDVRSLVLPVLLGLAFLWVFRGVLSGLISDWYRDSNSSHGFVVPFFSLYLIWAKRDQFRRTALAPQPILGLLVLVGSMLVLIVGVLGSENFLARSSMLGALLGCILYLHGWARFRVIWGAWLFLFLMIPIPAIILNEITFPLQLLASRMASGVLPLFGVPVLREGNLIHVPAMILEVAEACSGIRSLISLTTLAIIAGYFLDSRLWIRVVLAMAALPIAIFANAFRIVGTGLAVQYWDAEKGQGFFHEFSGWVIFLVSLGMLLGLYSLLARKRTVRVEPQPS